jgi:hypothetical protein
MAEQVPQWYQDQWATSVTHRYQADGYLLQGMTMPSVNIVGNTFHFLRTAKVDIQGVWPRGSDAIPLNPNDDTLSITSQRWAAPFELHDFDYTRIPVKEADARQQDAARALGRKADRIIMDALMAITLPAGQIAGSVAPAMTPQILQTGIATMFDNDVPDDGQIFCGIPAVPWEQLKNYRVFANADYIGPSDLPLVNRAEKRTWNGVHCFRLPKHLVNYKTVSTSNDTWRFRMWHKSALGAGHNETLKTEWQRFAKSGIWFLNHWFTGACIGLQTEGIYELQVTVGSSINPEVIQTHAVS